MKTLLRLFSGVSITLMLAGCKKGNVESEFPLTTAPTYTTSIVKVNYITSTSANFTASITSTGGGIVANKAFFLSLSTPVTDTSSAPILTGGGIGEFSANPQDLKPGSLYFVVSAYKKTNDGAWFLGPETSFKTLPKFTLGKVLPNGDIVYKIVGKYNDSAWVVSNVFGEGIFGCYGTFYPGTVDSIGAGIANTEILSSCSSGIANSLKKSGYWSPSPAEMREIYLLRFMIPSIKSRMANGEYWTSKDLSDTTATVFSWTSGIAVPGGKWNGVALNSGNRFYGNQFYRNQLYGKHFYIGIRIVK